METIKFSEWDKFDLRVGKILKAENIEGADKLYKVTVDLGKEKRILIAGLKPYYKPEELKNKIFQSFDKIRIYTKEPRKEKSPKPMILNPDSTIKDIAEKILKGFSSKVRESKIWGPSSKFPGQKVGLQHKLKDLDVVEFKTR